MLVAIVDILTLKKEVRNFATVRRVVVFRKFFTLYASDMVIPV